MFKGSMVALVTPFNEDNTINYPVLDQLVDFHLNHKTDALVLLGTTSESPVLSFDEESIIVSRVVNKVNHRIPIIVGSGSNNTKEAVWQSQRFEEIGVDGLLVITPYYNKTNEAGMYHHFKAVADNVSIPIILYNVPSRTGCSISLSNIEKLSKFDNIVGLKEASGNMSYATSVAKLINENFSLYSGNDDIVLPLLSLGASGVISVFANVYPEQMHNLVQSYFDGDILASRAIQLEYLDIIHDMFIEVNPIPVKEALNYFGFNVGSCRLPLFEMSKENKEKLHNSLDTKEFVR
jgi:4-hydroxy-tetrahydrodipicolinate synthase